MEKKLKSLCFDRFYDLGEKRFDRFTAIYKKQYQDAGNPIGNFECLVMSINPLHPQGSGQHTLCRLGRHLGKRIQFSDLPESCQKALWSLSALL